MVSLSRCGVPCDYKLAGLLTPEVLLDLRPALSLFLLRIAHGTHSSSHHLAHGLAGTLGMEYSAPLSASMLHVLTCLQLPLTIAWSPGLLLMPGILTTV